MKVAQLLFITSVDESRKLVCQAPACGRAIAKAVHVIRDSTGAIQVVGSGCYATLSGHEQATKRGATIGWSDSQPLTPDERALMFADTAAFVAAVEARLAADREAERQADVRAAAEAQRMRDERSRQSDVSGRGRAGNTASDSQRMAQFRAQQARQAARDAIQRRPELSIFSLEVVANAMARAKAEYVGRGHRMDAPDARSAIEAAAIAALADRTLRKP